MPIGSTGARNAILDATLGPNQHSSIPDPLFIALYKDDPVAGGIEITGGGYVRAPITKGMWALAASGQKTNSVAVAFEVSTGAWSFPATHLALLDSSVGGTVYDTGQLSAVLTVSGAGTIVRFNIGQIIVSQF